MAGSNDDKMKGAWACVTGASSGIGTSANRDCAPDPAAKYCMCTRLDQRVLAPRATSLMQNLSSIQAERLPWRWLVRA